MWNNFLVAIAPFGTIYAELILAKLFIGALVLNVLWNHERAGVSPSSSEPGDRATSSKAAEPRFRMVDAPSQVSRDFEALRDLRKDPRVTPHEYFEGKAVFEGKHGKLTTMRAFLLWLGIEEADDQDQDR